jgi:hypothetical protein
LSLHIVLGAAHRFKDFLLNDVADDVIVRYHNRFLGLVISHILVPTMTEVRSKLTGNPEVPLE